MLVHKDRRDYIVVFDEQDKTTRYGKLSNPMFGVAKDLDCMSMDYLSQKGYPTKQCVGIREYDKNTILPLI